MVCFLLVDVKKCNMLFKCKPMKEALDQVTKLNAHYYFLPVA